MGPRVRGTRTTWLLFALAALVALLLALHGARRSERRPAPAPARDGGTLIELELAD
jgi:hypothetical protein